MSFSSSGGAGNVAETLAYGLSKIGLDANLITATSADLRSKPVEHPALTFSAAKDLYIHKAATWKSLISLSRDKHSVLARSIPPGELTIFRWMNGLLGEEFANSHSNLGKLIWGLDDMNPFTGACHYSDACTGFESDCSDCPAVRPPFKGMVEVNLKRKIQFAHDNKLAFVAPTEWMHGEFQKSRLGQDREIRKILNPLQSRFFEGRSDTGNQTRKLKLLIVAANLDDPTKGIRLVAESLNRFLNRTNVEVTLVGRSSNKLSALIPEAKFMGLLSSASVMQHMSAHDVLLVPSLFENAGTVVAEAASQGLPTIARNVGGMPEMTNFGVTGYLFKTNEELNGILDSLSNAELSSKGNLAMEWAQQLRPELIATQYAETFL